MTTKQILLVLIRIFDFSYVPPYYFNFRIQNLVNEFKKTKRDLFTKNKKLYLNP